MYSLGQVFKQEPANVVAVFMLMINLLIALQVVAMTDIQIAATNALLLPLLNLFYVRPMTVSRDALNKLGGKK